MHYRAKLTANNSFVNGLHTNDVLDLSFGSSANNTPIVAYTRSGRANQQWVLQKLSNLIVNDQLTPPTVNSRLSLTVNVVDL